MRSEYRNLLIEIKRHFTFKLIAWISIFLILLFIPVIFLLQKVVFDPAEFINLYLSTAFTAILIGIILQVIELYKTNSANISRTYTFLTEFKKSCELLKDKINNNVQEYNFYHQLLTYYQSIINTVFVPDHTINQHLIQLYYSEDLEYVKEITKNNSILSNLQKEKLVEHINLLIKSINKILEVI